MQKFKKNFIDIKRNWVFRVKNYTYSSIKSLFSQTQLPTNNIQNINTIVLPIIYNFLLSLHIHPFNWFLWNESPFPPIIPTIRVRERSYLSPPSANQEQPNRWQSRNLEWPASHPRKPPPVAVTLGRGKDARGPSLMQLHHFMRAPIGSRCTSTLKAITSPRRPVIIASLACSTREARVDCVMTWLL